MKKPKCLASLLCLYLLFPPLSFAEGDGSSPDADCVAALDGGDQRKALELSQYLGPEDSSFASYLCQAEVRVLASDTGKAWLYARLASLAARTPSEFVSAYSVLSTAYRLADRRDDARTALDEAERRRPKNGLAAEAARRLVFYRALSLLDEQGETTETRALVSTLGTELGGEHVYTIVLNEALGNAARDRRDPMMAIVHYSVALDTAKAGRSVSEGMLDTLATRLFHAYREMDMSAQARELLSDMGERARQRADVRGEAESLLLEVDLHQELEQWEEAAASAVRAYEQLSDAPDADEHKQRYLLHALGAAQGLRARKQFAEAERVFLETIHRARQDQLTDVAQLGCIGLAFLAADWALTEPAQGRRLLATLRHEFGGGTYAKAWLHWTDTMITSKGKPSAAAKKEMAERFRKAGDENRAGWMERGLLNIREGWSPDGYGQLRQSCLNGLASLDELKQALKARLGRDPAADDFNEHFSSYCDCRATAKSTTWSQFLVYVTSNRFMALETQKNAKLCAPRMEETLERLRS